MNSLGLSGNVFALLRAVLVAVLAWALLAAPARAASTSSNSASRFYISGAGFGHGVGMSQYGAAGFALHGFTYEQILAHYYSSTTLGRVDPDRLVTVLLHEGAATFSGATGIVGLRKHLNPHINYGVIPIGSRLRIIAGGRTVGTFWPPVTVQSNGAPLTLVGQGRYQGAFVFRPDGTGAVMTVNSVGLENYLRGVVTAEMPSTWPAQALEAQAIAARTYAITAGAVASDFDVYDDTRSQMYGGIGAETPAGNAAVAATTGQVVEYDDQPVTTYFFASSGGYTESVQNVWYGIAPEAWLHGVPDPYDDSYNNPYYRWTDRYAVPAAAQKLRNFYRGAFEGIEVMQTGVSPRVVRARVVGSRGSGIVDGAQLQQLLGTLSTYMSFTTLTEKGERTETVVRTPVRTGDGNVATAPTATLPAFPTTTNTTTTSPPTTTDTTPTTTDTTPATTTNATTTQTAAMSVRRSAAVRNKKVIQLSLRGTVYPARAGATVTAQRATGAGWRSVASARVTANGGYVIPLQTAGTYRAVINGIEGPSVRVP